jgi:hypothetical protein
MFAKVSTGAGDAGASALAAKIFTIFEGTPEIQRTIVGRTVTCWTPATLTYGFAGSHKEDRPSCSQVGRPVRVSLLSGMPIISRRFRAAC